jgi:hypothetical protein
MAARNALGTSATDALTTGTADERIRVRARGGEEVTWPREAARNAGTLKDLMDDAPPEDGVYPVPKIVAWTLDLLGKLSDPGTTRPSIDECSMPQLMELVEGALFLDADRALEHIQRAIARRLNGQRAQDLCVVLGASGDFDGAEERAEALAEPAFLPEGYEAPQQLGAASSSAPPAPLRQPSLSGVPATEDAMEAALAIVDVATLCELKGVNRFWRALSRRVLCSRLCRGRGQPAPTHLEEITDLDVELLIEAGRPGDTALAGRMLPGLARLRGYGFVVDVAKVRAATLDEKDDEDNDENNDEGQEGSLLRGTAKAALDSCISGDGEAPLKLTIAAVACAGSGVACGIPVQHMREDTMTELDLRKERLCGPGAMLVSDLISAMGALKRVDVRHNNIAGDVTMQLSAAVLGNLKIEMFNEIPLKEMRANSLTELDLKGNGVGVEGGMVVAGLIPVMGALTSIDLSNNHLCGVRIDHRDREIGTYTADGIIAIADALRVNGALTKLSLARNKLKEAGTKAICEALEQNTTLKELDISGDRRRSNTGGSAGAKHVAKMLRVKGALTKLSLARNQLEEAGTKSICEALEQNTTLKELDISGGHDDYNIGYNIGSAGAKHVAKMLRVNGTLTSVDLSENHLTHYGKDMTGIKELAAALAVNGGLTSIDLSGSQLCGIGTDSMGYKNGTYTAEGITAIADALRVSGGLTSIDLSNDALDGIWTDRCDEQGTYTAEGIIAIADALRVNGALMKVRSACSPGVLPLALTSGCPLVHR